MTDKLDEVVYDVAKKEGFWGVGKRLADDRDAIAYVLHKEGQERATIIEFSGREIRECPYFGWRDMILAKLAGEANDEPEAEEKPKKKRGRPPKAKAEAEE